MGSCTACGDCCDPVWYPLGPADIRQSASTTGAEDLVFAAAHWTATGATTPDGMHAYSCDRFNPASRLCIAHDERPPICRAYPQPANVLPLRCGFRDESSSTLASRLEPVARDLLTGQAMSGSCRHV